MVTIAICIMCCEIKLKYSLDVIKFKVIKGTFMDTEEKKEKDKDIFDRTYVGKAKYGTYNFNSNWVHHI